jgi:hypothetical protein
MKPLLLLRCGALSLAATLALAPAPSDALPPLVAMFVKEMVKQTLKDMLLSGLSEQGCKGIALANAISALDIGKGGLKGGMPGGLGAMPQMPAGMTMPNMPNMPKMPAGAGAVAGAPGAAGAIGSAGALGGLMPQMAAQMPPGMALTPEQMTMIASMQTAMSQPLSPVESLAVMDEMAELGMLPKSIHAEIKECMVVLPQTAAAVGMGMAMLKPVIPQMRQGRDMLRNASPQEQDEMIVMLAEQLQTSSPAERKSFVEMLDGGFFPPRVSEGVKTRLANLK